MGPSRKILLFSLAITFSVSLILSPTNAQKLIAPKPTIPYQTVNNFCLYKRLNVNKPFCLRVLKNPSAANAKPNEFTPLLQVAINSTSDFICKTLTLLQDKNEDLKTRPKLMPAIGECLTAYEEIAGYITYIITDASQESAIAGLDGEVIGEYVNVCVKAMEKTADPEISWRNKEAKNYAKLLIDIADSLSTKKHK